MFLVQVVFSTCFHVFELFLNCAVFFAWFYVVWDWFRLGLLMFLLFPTMSLLFLIVLGSVFLSQVVFCSFFVVCRFKAVFVFCLCIRSFCVVLGRFRWLGDVQCVLSSVGVFGLF